MIRRFAIALAIFAAACGGGGSGGGSPAGTPAAPSAPPPFVVSPSTVKVTYPAGTSVSVALTATRQVTISSPVTVKIVDTVGVIQPNASISPNPDGISYKAILNMSATLPAGHYTGNFAVSVCLDTACNQPVAGSPVLVPFDVTVVAVPTGSNLTPLAPLAGAADWQTFQGNAAHTGYVPVTLDPAAFTQRWTWTAPGDPATAAYALISTPATGNGMVYLVGLGSRLYALKEQDASVAWTQDMPTGAFTGPPAAAAGKVYVATRYPSEALRAFNGIDGKGVFASGLATQPMTAYPPVVSGNLVLQPTQSMQTADSFAGVYALDANAGTQLFFTSLYQDWSWTPAADANGIYGFAVKSDGTAQLDLLDRTTGAVGKTITAPGFSNANFTGVPVLGATGSVFARAVSSAKSQLLDVNTSTGGVAWGIDPAGPPAYHGGVLYVNVGAGFEARSESTGAVLWSWSPDSMLVESMSVSPVVLTDNLAFVSSAYFTRAIDLQTHREVWTYPHGGQLAISANGILYVASTRDGKLFAVNLK